MRCRISCVNSNKIYDKTQKFHYVCGNSRRKVNAGSKDKLLKLCKKMATPAALSCVRIGLRLRQK